MANIKTTVDGMPKKDVIVKAPTAVAPPALAEIPAAKIKEIVKEMVQPWKYGIHLARFAKRHEVPIESIREIEKAILARVAAETAEVP
jgi:hypothetical protein